MNIKKMLPGLLRLTTILFVLCILAVFISASEKETVKKPGTDAEYIAKVKQWQQKRLQGLKRKNGWLSLAGLFWLNEGENTFGSDQANDLIIEEVPAPARIGSFFLEKGAVRFTAAPGELVMNETNAVLETPMKSDAEPEPTVLSVGSLSWFVIKRGDRMGIRLRDSEHPRIAKLKAIDSYPINPEWRVKAKLEKFDKPQTVKIPTVLGTENNEPTPGRLVFKIKDQTFQLTPLGDSKGLFLIFADTTNGSETYGGGRFLSVPGVDEQGYTYIDFNMATCPPCAFSPHATCPMPPKENRLTIRVTAGEKIPAGFKH